VLGLIIAKSKINGGMPFEHFTKLYDALVMSIITYGYAIWGFKNYNSVNTIHNRACRYFLGVSKYSPNAPCMETWFGNHLFSGNGYLSVGNGVDCLIWLRTGLRGKYLCGVQKT